MFDPLTFFLIFVTFLVAGSVKGLIGLGLPTVSLGLLAAIMELPTAMALMIAPSFITNVYQASSGGNARAIILRIWPFLIMAMSTVWIGAIALTKIELDFLTALLGFLLIAYGGLNFTGFCFKISSYSEHRMGLVLGAANGILTGMTGSFAVPGVMYLQAIGLQRELLVQAMGMLFTVSTAALAFAMGTNALLSKQLGIASLFAVLPALIGLRIGQNLRQCLSETQFQQILLIGIILLGIHLVIGSLVVVR